MAETDQPELPPLEEPVEVSPEVARKLRERAREKARPKRVHRRRPAARSSTSSSESPGPRTSGAPAGKELVIREIGEALVTLQVAVGTGAQVILPVTGAVMMRRAGMGADVAMSAMRRDPRVYAAFVRLYRASSWAELAALVGFWAVAVAVDVGTLPADNALAQRMVGDEIAEVMKANERAAASNGVPPAGEPSPLDTWSVPNAVG